MTRSIWTRLFAPLALATTLTLATAPTSALAQEPPPAEGEASEGRPLDGYFATACLVGLALFLVAKTARR
jgi:hypothetical protein